MPYVGNKGPDHQPAYLLCLIGACTFAQSDHGLHDSPTPSIDTVKNLSMDREIPGQIVMMSRLTWAFALCI